MNQFLRHSISYAAQRSYLDDLFRIYPTIPDGLRDIDDAVWGDVETAFVAKDNVSLVRNLLKLDLFPIKDGYVAYLRRDKTALDRNPQTINRLAGQMYALGLSKLYERCSVPKETNRQMGEAFKNWLKKEELGVPLLGIEDFLATKGNAILMGRDSTLQSFAAEHFGYHRDKGLDLVARFNGKYVIGEAKFLTDFGGHQNAQFIDAIATLRTPCQNIIKIAILDGVLYIKGRSKMYKEITKKYSNLNIMSALVLRDFLYQI